MLPNGPHQIIKNSERRRDEVHQIKVFRTVFNLDEREAFQLAKRYRSAMRSECRRERETSRREAVANGTAHAPDTLVNGRTDVNSSSSDEAMTLDDIEQQMRRVHASGRNLGGIDTDLSLSDRYRP